MTSKPVRVNLWEEGNYANAEVVTKFLFFIQPYWSKVAHFFYRRESVIRCLENIGKQVAMTSGVRLNKCVSYVI